MDLLLTDVRIASMAGDDYGVMDGDALAIAGGRIAWLGARQDAPEATETRSLAGRWITPALIDCHTHLVFGGDRSGEFEQRLRGASYEAIARAGGGIMSTVRATREASADELYAAALPRIEALLAEGVATIEIKSGYGLNIETELKMLAVAKQLGDATPATVCTTLLAAHTVPPEYQDDADSYISLICDEILPEVAAGKLADAVDAYCESIAFSPAQVTRVFERALELDLPVKLHADQLSDGGGAALAASMSALSADHLEYTSANGVQAMADAGTVAVLLPGAFLTLGETQLPPIDAMREHGVPIAVATDCNPGTCWCESMQLMIALACRYTGMTPAEAISAATINAAHAIGWGQEVGSLEPGKRADLLLLDVPSYPHLGYRFGANLVQTVIAGGQLIRGVAKSQVDG